MLSRNAVVMTTVILVLTFVLAILPAGLLQRLFRRDMLGLKFDAKRDSYWAPVEPDGPWSRPDKPY